MTMAVFLQPVSPQWRAILAFERCQINAGLITSPVPSASAAKNIDGLLYMTIPHS
jgi:hypothetical protein